jgi:hypothetical protein
MNTIKKTISWFDHFLEWMWNQDDAIYCFALFMLPYLIIGVYVFGSIIAGLF